MHNRKNRHKKKNHFKRFTTPEQQTACKSVCIQLKWLRCNEIEITGMQQSHSHARGDPAVQIKRCGITCVKLCVCMFLILVHSVCVQRYVYPKIEMMLWFNWMASAIFQIDFEFWILVSFFMSLIFTYRFYMLSLAQNYS